MNLSNVQKKDTQAFRRKKGATPSLNRDLKFKRKDLLNIMSK